MKYFLKILLILITLFYASHADGQKKRRALIDSLLKVLQTAKDDTNKVKLLDEITNAFPYDFPDDGMIYDNAEINLASKLHWKKGIADGYGHLGDDYATKENYKLAAQCYFKSLYLYDTLKDDKNNGRMLIKLAMAYRAQRNFDSGLVVVSRALNIFGRIRDSDDLAEAYGNLGILYMSKNDFKRSLENSFKCLAVADSMHIESVSAEIRGVIGMDYLALVDTASNAQTDKIRKANKENLQNAIMYLKQGVDGCLKAQGDGNMALDDARDFSDNLSGAYSLAGDYQQAYETALQTVNIKDSISAHDKNLGTGIREQVVQMNEKQLQKDRREITLKKNQQVLFIIMIVLLFIIIVLAFRNFRTQRHKMELQRMLMANKIRNDIAEDLHDDIGASLSSIILMSDIAQQKPLQTADYLAQISDTSGKVIENMGDIVWAVNPNNDTMEQILVRMREFAASLLEKKDINLHFDTGDDLALVKLGMDQRKNFYLISKEIIHNAFKYSGCSNVAVHLQLQADRKTIVMEITDDGKGFDTGQKYTGNGLRNMQKRAAEINGTLELASAPGKGTKVKLSFATASTT